MRSIKEILELMLTHFDKYVNYENYPGLCGLSHGLFVNDILNRSEYLKISGYIYENKPIKVYTDRYYWEPYISGPRKAWLKRHIKFQDDEKH